MKTIISFQIDCGVLGQLEMTASAECARDGEEITAESPYVSVYIPSVSGTGMHTYVTHLIDPDELDTITEKVMAAFLARSENKEPETSLYNN